MTTRFVYALDLCMYLGPACKLHDLEQTWLSWACMLQEEMICRASAAAQELAEVHSMYK